MASDGNIDKREVELIKKMCELSPLFKDFDFNSEINLLLSKINDRGSEFIQYYFDILNNSKFSEQEELTLIDFAIKTINADEIVEYSEIKFFKAIRKCLDISDDKILENYPDIEVFLEEDINIESELDKIVDNYLKSVEIPKFDKIDFDSLDN